MNLRTCFTALAAVVAVSFTCAASASATEIISEEGALYTSTVKAASEGGHVILHGPSGGITAECESSLEGSVESHGSGVTAEGAVSSLSFSSCTGGYSVHVKKAGSLILHATGGGNGTLTSSGAEIQVTANTIFGTISCIYTTSSTDIGTLTGSWTTEGTATLDISATIPRTGGSSLCGSTGTWTGSYKITTPATFAVHDLALEPNAEAGTGMAEEIQKFKVNETKVMTVDDKIGNVVWTLEKVDVAVESGTWGLEEGTNCVNKPVNGKGVICKVKVICAAKGDARFQLYVASGNPKKTEIRFTRLKCA